MNWFEQAATLLPDVMGWDRAWPYLLAALIAGYLIGSIPFGVIIARVAGLGDLRKVGSGNIGATNVLRTGNKAAAAGTLLLDMAKGLIAVLLVTASYGDLPGELAGIGACLGHCFPIWLRFKGGKAVATFIGVIFGFNLIAGLAVCATWLAAAALFRISSLSALIAALTAPIWLFTLGAKSPVWAAALLVILIYLRHHENIARLIRGTEPKIGAR